MKIRKLSIVLYCNDGFDDIKKSLESIEKQELNKLYYDVVILNDNANDIVAKQINDYIKENELSSNHYIVSFEGHTGLPILLDFALKNGLINSEYLTIIKANDTYEKGWISHFFQKLLPLKYDMYLTNLYDYFIYDKIKTDRKSKKEIKTTYLRRSRYWPIDGNSSLVEKEEVIQTKPYFLGKIWKTSIVEKINVLPEKILYQDIYLYYQLVLFSNSFYYINKFSGKIVHKNWIPREMTERRIELLCETINRMISKNPYLNGILLELLANAIVSTSKKDLKHYIIKNHEYLNDYVIWKRMHDLSKRKIKKTTSGIVKLGIIPNEKNKEQKNT